MALGSRCFSREDGGEDEVEPDEPDEALYNPPLPSTKAHTLTDRTCCILVPVFALVYIASLWYAVVNGDPRRLFHGFDWHGQLCGVAVPDKEFLYWCEPATLDSDYWKPVCVHHCPAGNETYAVDTCGSARFDQTYDYATKIFADRYCLPTSSTEFDEVVMEQIQRQPLVYEFMTLASDIVVAWGPLVAAVVLSVTQAFVYLRLTAKCGDFMWWLSAFFLTSSALVLFIVLILTGASGGSDGVAHTGDGISDWTWAAVVFGLWLVFLIVMCRQMRSVRSMIQCVDVACECLWEHPSLILEPVFALSLKVAVMCFWAGGFVWLASCGEIKAKSGGGVHREFTWKPEEYFLMLYQVAAGAWMYSFIDALSHYSIAHAVEIWYFLPYRRGGTKVTSPLNWCTGVFLALRYHLGTMALGASLSWMWLLPALPLRRYQSSSKKDAPSALGVRPTHAYFDVALTSQPYCSAARRACSLLVQGQQGVMLRMGACFPYKVVGAMVMGTTGLSLPWFLVHHLDCFDDPRSELDVQAPKTLALVGGIASFVTAWPLMGLIDCVSDVLMYCYSVDVQRRRHFVEQAAGGQTFPAKFKYKDPERTGLLGRPHKAEIHTGALADPVNYCPPKLKKLLTSET